MAGQFWPEIAGSYNQGTGLDLAKQDTVTFLNVVYSYNVSGINEFRFDARKSMDEFLEGTADDRLAAEDTREIQELMPDLLADWDSIAADFGAPKPTPPAE